MRRTCCYLIGNCTCFCFPTNYLVHTVLSGNHIPRVYGLQSFAHYQIKQMKLGSHTNASPLLMDDAEYRVYIRIPAPRPPGFSDPPTFVWNAEKEATLWKVISRRTRVDINCTLASVSSGNCRGRAGYCVPS